MNEWMTDIAASTKIILGNPGPIELAVLLLLGIIAFIAVMTGMGNALSFPVSTMKRSALLFAINAVIILAAATATHLYLSPKVSNETLAGYLPVAAAAVVVLAATVPSARLFQRAPYFKALFAVILSIAAAAGVMALAKGAFNAAGSGGKSAEKIKARTEAVDDLLSK